MKALGIIRRIDDLGRVVIPKEIRRNMGLKEGDPLEIYTDRDGTIIFKKYTPDNTADVVKYLVNSARTLGFNIGVYDDNGLYLSGPSLGAEHGKISVDETEELIPVADEDIYGRAFLYVNVLETPEDKTIETIKALAQMAAVMLNEG